MPKKHDITGSLRTRETERPRVGMAPPSPNSILREFRPGFVNEGILTTHRGGSSAGSLVEGEPGG